MTFLKIVLFFIYFKIQELVVFLWKSIIRPMLWPVTVIVLFFGAIGAVGIGALRCWHWFDSMVVLPRTATWYVTEFLNSDQITKISQMGTVEWVVAGAVLGFMLFCFGGLTYAIGEVLVKNWYRIPECMTANWQKATVRVKGQE